MRLHLRGVQRRRNKIVGKTGIEAAAFVQQNILRQRPPHALDHAAVGLAFDERAVYNLAHVVNGHQPFHLGQPGKQVYLTQCHVPCATI